MLDMVIDLKITTMVGARAGGAGGPRARQWGFPAALSKWLFVRRGVSFARRARASRARRRAACGHERAQRSGGAARLPGRLFLSAARAAQGAMDDRARRAGGARAPARAVGEGQGDAHEHRGATRHLVASSWALEGRADACADSSRLPLADGRARPRGAALVACECCARRNAATCPPARAVGRVCERMPLFVRPTLQLAACGTRSARWRRNRTRRENTRRRNTRRARSRASDGWRTWRGRAPGAWCPAPCALRRAQSGELRRRGRVAARETLPPSRFVRSSRAPSPRRRRNEGRCAPSFRRWRRRVWARGGRRTRGALRASLANALGARGRTEAREGGRGRRRLRGVRRETRGRGAEQDLARGGAGVRREVDRSRRIERAERELRAVLRRKSIAATAPTSLTRRAIFQNVTRNGIPAFSKKY